MKMRHTKIARGSEGIAIKLPLGAGYTKDNEIKLCLCVNKIVLRIVIS